MDASALIRTLELSNNGQGEYLVGRPLGNSYAAGMGLTIDSA